MHLLELYILMSAVKGTLLKYDIKYDTAEIRHVFVINPNFNYQKTSLKN